MIFLKYKTAAVTLTTSICLMLVYVSCSNDKSKPALEYMPDMYRSPSYETYQPSPVTSDGKSALSPVEGTVPRGFLPYAYPNTTEGYIMAGQNLKNPLEINQQTIGQGKVLYTKFCISCHGDKGDGNGQIVANNKFPARPPSYQGDVLLALPVGKMFHSITYGKGMMGSHASQLSQEDRWKIVAYITTVLQGRTKIEGDQTAMAAPTEIK
jgi:mono/diheme cytochrome c family protein